MKNPVVLLVAMAMFIYGVWPLPPLRFWCAVVPVAVFAFAVAFAIRDREEKP